jgi:hypothetical protein
MPGFPRGWIWPWKSPGNKKRLFMTRVSMS